MEFDFWPAVWAGILGGVVMSMLDWMAKPVGMTMDPHRMWGGMLKMHGGSGYAAGFVMHLIMSAAIALAYAIGFDIVGASSNLWAWGLLGGAIHWLIAGVMVMPMMPIMHPEMPDQRMPPGVLLKNYGMPDVPGFLMSHLAYGVVVGIAYERLT